MPKEPNQDQPIVVNDTQLPGTAATLLRYAATAIGGVLVTRGFLPADSDVNAIVGSVLIVASAVYGVYKTWSNKRKLIKASDAAPNDVAIVTRK
jgi:hypothetical protein